MELSFASKDFIAGGVSGALGVLAGQPLDTIRVRIQQGNQSKFGATMWGCYLQTLKTEGLFGLYRGVSYPLLTVAFQNAIIFQAFGIGNRLLQDWGGNGFTNLFCVTFAGMFSGLVQNSITCPIDVLKIRLQVQKDMPGQSTYVGALPMLYKIIRNEGIQGLYRGLTITAIRDVPSFGVYFAVYEACKFNQHFNNDHMISHFVAGGIAGVVSWAVVYPFDVIKSRIQSSSNLQYYSWYQCMIDSYRKEGGAVFFRGLDACLTRAFLVNAVIFLAYETSLNVLNYNSSHAE
eukprot:TRINITY_DN27042_c1_g2_i1.p1 TRINITY_DN27042_c1_g2~~TRINITY_DN27042_c1_g2_i1.p1  ORF type:complete len:290 (-),score=26.86 TRINITY_DN27042_c1_g2_i1:285-1154(-)